MASHLLSSLEDGCKVRISGSNGEKCHDLILLPADSELLIKVNDFNKATQKALEAGYDLLKPRKELALALQNSLTVDELKSSPFRSIIIMHEPFLFKNKAGRYMITLDRTRINIVQFIETVTPLPKHPSKIGLIFSKNNHLF